MGWRDWMPWWQRGGGVAAVQNLPEARMAHLQEAMMAPGGVVIDADEDAWRRTSAGQRMKTRDLTSVQQDRMLEIAWYLFEANPLAKRLVTMMADLVVGTGLSVTAKDERINQVLRDTWKHPVNQFDRRLREFYLANSLNGELAMPAARNPVTGVPHLGYIDPLQIDRVEFRADNVLVPETLVLKADPGSSSGLRLKIITPDLASGLLDGEVFYHRTNALPNSSRGRSDLLALADWLDLYDSLMFSEVERLKLLSAFVWDLKIDGADEKLIRQRVKDFGTPTPGTVFGHNQKETLEARTPDLQAQDRSEVAKMLAIHIAGAHGFPITWLGYTDSNNATIQGQNDVMMKTPAARQQEFAGFLGTIMSYAIEGATGRNRALYRDAAVDFDIQVPEIAAKDIARVGGVVSAVVGAMDVAMANRTISRRAAVITQLAVLKQLGVDLDVNEVLDQADQEGEEAQAKDDERMALAAKARLAQEQTRSQADPGEDDDTLTPARKPSRKRQPPQVPVDDEGVGAGVA